MCTILRFCVASILSVNPLLTLAVCMRPSAVNRIVSSQIAVLFTSLSSYYLMFHDELSAAHVNDFAVLCYSNFISHSGAEFSCLHEATSC